MLNKALSHFQETRQVHLEDLKNLIRIPSVSFDGFPPEKVRQSADAVASLLRARGLENVEVLNMGSTHPYVYGDWLHAPGKPTVLLYAHHDVQPPGRDHLWKTPPFEPVEINGRLYGRGAADDKAGVVVHTAAIESYLKTSGKLPLNVRMIVEGEEEIGSAHLAEFLRKYKSKLKADAMVLTDTGNYDTGVPAITVALRGLVEFQIEVRALKGSVHSGMWGGPTPDPAMALNKILAALTDTENRIIIPGVWDEVSSTSKAELEEIEALNFDATELRRQAGVLPGVRLMPARDGTVKPLVQLWREPSLVINTMEVSLRKQAANIINDTAWARFGIRLAPKMDPHRTGKLVLDYVRKIAPWGMHVSIEVESMARPWSTQPKGPAFESAFRALEKGYGRKAIAMGCGATIPFVDSFEQELGDVPALLIGVEDPYTNAHSENESMGLSDFEKAIKSAIYFYDDFSRARAR